MQGQQASPPSTHPFLAAQRALPTHPLLCVPRPTPPPFSTHGHNTLPAATATSAAAPFGAAPELDGGVAAAAASDLNYHDDSVFGGTPGGAGELGGSKGSSLLAAQPDAPLQALANALMEAQVCVHSAWVNQ